MALNPEIVSHLREIHIGTATFYGYGLIIALSALITFVLFWKLNQNKKIKEAVTPGFLLTLTVFSIILGRLFSVISQVDYYCAHLKEIPNLHFGGMSIFGVIVGIIFAYALYQNIAHLKPELVEFLDAIVPFVALSQSIGRWGNFINQELYGPPTNLPWKMYISPKYRYAEYESFAYFHPAFLYESILDFFLFVYLLKTSREKKFHKNSGFLTGAYGIIYGFIRILINRFRLGDTMIAGVLGTTDLWALLLVFSGIILVIKSNDGKGRKSLFSKSRH